MPSPIGGDRVKQTAEAEHIGPDYTGDNISAKKVANYNWSGSDWQRQIQPLTDTQLRATPVPTTDTTAQALLQQIETNTEAMQALCVVVKTLHQATVNPPYMDKSANAIRNQVQSGTVTTVTTVTNLTNFGTQAADVTYRINSLTAWANSVRRTIS